MKNKLKTVVDTGLLVAIFSFVGWLFETVSFYFVYGGFHDRGFLTLPFCPIYGFSLLTVFWLLGSFREGGVLLRGIKSGTKRVFLYLLGAVFIPTLIEFIVGTGSEILFNRVLWDYSLFRFSFGKYICLEFSILWGALISIASFLWFYLLKKLSRVSLLITLPISIFIWVAISLDFIYNAVVSII